jgi:hypothetical protein
MAEEVVGEHQSARQWYIHERSRIELDQTCIEWPDVWADAREQVFEAGPGGALANQQFTAVIPPDHGECST